MIKEFKIEGKNLKYQTTNLYSNKFVVKSMPQDYKVEFKNKVSDLETYFRKKFKDPNSRFVIWDKNILSLYGNDLSLLNNNQFILNAIESKKNSQSVFKIIDILQGINFTKKETIISVGGGITQDVTAFTRSIFKWLFDTAYSLRKNKKI